MIKFYIIKLPREIGNRQTVRVKSAIEILKNDALKIKILRRHERADGFDAGSIVGRRAVKFQIFDDDIFDTFADTEKCAICTAQTDPAGIFIDDIIDRRERRNAADALNY